MKKRRIISIIAILSMLFSLFPVQPMTANAALPDKGKIEMVYLKQILGDDPKDTVNYGGNRLRELTTGESLNDAIIQQDGTQGRTGDLQAGDSFWVGIKVSNLQALKNFDQTKNYAGLVNLSVGLVYDSEYLYDVYEAQYKVGKNMLELPLTNSNSFVPGLTSGESNALLYDLLPYLNDSPTDTSLSIDPAGDIGDYYSLNNGSNKNQTISSDDYKINGSSDTTSKEVFVNYVKADTSTTNGMFTADEGIIAIMRFKIKAVPADGAPVFKFDNSNSALAMGFTTDAASAVADVSIQNNATDIKADDYQYYMELPTVVNPFPATYTVTYDANASNFTGASYDSSVVPGTDDVEKVKDGDSPKLKNAAGKVISSLLTPPNNKVFEGWYTSATEFSESTKFDTSSTVSQNTTVYANYTDGHKVTFHLNGTNAQFNDSTTDDKKIEATSGTALFGASDTFATKLGGEPTRTDYNFIGWYTKSDSGAFVKKYEETDLRSETTNSIDLYARWEPSSAGTYTLNFDKNTTSAGATDSDPTSVTFNSGESLDDVIGGLPIEPTRTGNYKFMGWYLNKSGDGAKLESTTNLATYTGVNDTNQTATVYARWDYLDDPDAAPNPLPYSDTVTVKFDKTDGTYNGGTYQYGTVTNGTIADKYVKLGEKIEYLPGADEMKQDGMAFDGWYTAATGGTKVTTDTPIDTSVGASAGGTITLYARWIDKVTLSYDLNGLPTDSFTAPASVTDFPDTSFTVATLASVTDYNFIAWNTSPDGTGTSYTAGDSTKKLPSSDTTLYAIWNYTGSDAVSIVFNGNGTATNPATVTPNDGSDTTKYVITRAPGSTVTAAQMPSATRTNYTFNHWGTTATEAALTGGATQDSLTVSAPSDGSKTINMYAIWTVTNPADARTVTFEPNASDASPATSTTVTVAVGDTVSALPTYTRTGYSLSGWMESPTYTSYDKNNAFTTATVVNDNITVKAYWTQNVTVTYHLNNGTLTSAVGSDDPVTLEYNGTLSGLSPAKTTPTVTRDNYTFKGWKYEDSTTHALVDFTDTTNVTKNIDVYASWEAKIQVEFNNADGTTGEIKYTYDGYAKTPLVDGNYKVSLLNGATVADDITSQFQLADFSATYTASAAGSTAVSTAPTDADVYTIALARNTSNATSTLDKYTTYTITAYPNTFEIEGATINYIVSDNYQYLNNTSGITKIGIAIDGIAPSSAPNINIADVLDNNAASPRKADINVKFTNKKDATKVFTNTMPDKFGEYKIEITATEGSNFKVGTVKDSENVTPAVLYLMRMSRVVNVDYGDGVVRAGGVDTTDHKKNNYAAVTISTPNPITAVANAKTTLASQTTPIALPVEGTDFTPPKGKTLEKFETRTYDTDGTTVKTKADFTATTDILSDPDDLTIYAVYKDAQWTVTFHDTKTTPAAEADKKYTVAAGKSILGPDDDSTASVKKIEQYNSGTSSYGDITTSVTDKTVLPKPTSAPKNMQFGGWTIDSTVAAKTNLTSADITGSGTYASKMFTNANYPGDSLITEAMGTDITVYAVYVKSSDATLNGVEFKETSSSGTIIAYRDSSYNVPTPAITFDSDTNTYYMVVANSVENVYGKLTPSQSGSTMKVEKNGTTITVSTPDGTTGAVDFTEAVAATTYDKDANKNSVNTFVVTVTPPDGDSNSAKTYTFNVLRYAKARVELNYGNSPYGRIMKDTSLIVDGDEAATKAKRDSAKSTFVTNKTYISPFDPTKTKLAEYVADEYDKDDYIYFKTLKTVNETTADLVDRVLVDPGFTAYNSLDKPVAAADVTRAMTVRKFTDPTLLKAGEAGVTSVTYTHTGTDNFTEVTNASSIVPDVYDMTYTFKDIDGTTDVTETRKIGITYELGDIDLSLAINANDTLAMRNQVNKIKLLSTLPFYFTRIADVDTSDALNANDTLAIRNNVNKVSYINQRYAN